MTTQQLVFIDETSAKTNMTRLRGRSPSGKRLYASAPLGCWTTSALVAGLRLDGWTTPMVPDGAIDGATFTAYTEQCLAPTLRCGVRCGDGQCVEPQGRWCS